MVGAMPVNIMPKFCNGSMEGHNGGEESEIQVKLGSRIKYFNDFATVKYIGEVQGYKGTWYGVEWDDASRGKHDGNVDGTQYFKTSKPNAGSFVRPNKIAPLRTCAEAIRKIYGDREDETVAAHRRTMINEWKREMGAPFIEMVGFEKIHQKQKLDRLIEVSVHDQNVCMSGDVGSLCPSVRNVDLSANLFSNWREVIQLSAQLPGLTGLDVSKNRMAIDMTEETLKQLSSNFNNLEKLNISMCDYEWTDIVSLSHLWPNIREMIAAFNRIKEITVPKTMVDLTALWLDGNLINSWNEIMKLGNLKRLKSLSVNDCPLEEIRFNDDPETKVNVFENLEVIFLNRTRINDWRSVSELNKLKKLKKLYFLKNPIQDTVNYDTASQLIIAKIGNLQELNGSMISSEQRRGAEYDYLKRYGAQYKLTEADEAARVDFNNRHCRFEALVRKYGLPDDNLLVTQTVNKTLTSQLLEITLYDEHGNTFKKRIPASMTVDKLVTLAHRIFSKTGNTGIPLLYSVDESRDDETKYYLDNMMKELGYYSIKNGDSILVRFK